MSKAPKSLAGKHVSETTDEQRALPALSEAEQLKLFDEVCASGGSPELTEKLQEALRSTPGAAERYLDYSAMHADLYGAVRLSRVRRLVCAELEGAAAQEVLRSDDSKHAPAAAGVSSLNASRFAAWAAPLLALAATALFVAWPGWNEPASSERGKAVRGAATRGPSGASEGAEWANAVAKVNRVNTTSSGFESGDMLLAGDTLEFTEGIAELEFQQGAVVAIEGPAKFSVSTHNSGVLESGRLAAVVPPWAEGFSVDTPKLQVVDRGAGFAVSVDKQQGVDVTVTKGEAEVFEADSQKAHSVLAGTAIRIDAVGLKAAEQDGSLVSLSTRLPALPDSSEVEVVGRYQHDWVSGTPGEPRRLGPWRYYTNLHGPIGDRAHYSELLWDPRNTGCYDGDGASGPAAQGVLSVVKLRRGSGHPGWGTKQSPDGVSRYAIAAFTVPTDGQYRIESGWLFRPENKPVDPSHPWREHQAVDVLVHVDDEEPLITAECRRDGFLQFGGPLGRLPAGATVYVGVGPGDTNYNDRFEWGFFVVRVLEPKPEGRF